MHLQVGVVAATCCCSLRSLSVTGTVLLLGYLLAAFLRNSGAIVFHHDAQDGQANR